MNGIDQISAEGQMYDILAPEVVNDYVEKVGKPCQNPYGYSAGSLMLAKDTEGVQRLYKVTQAINNGQDILEGTNCEKRKLGECFDDVDDEIDSVKQALTDEASARSQLGSHNLLSYPFYDGGTQVINGITFTVNDDGTITVSGTASAITEFRLHSIYLTPTDCKIKNGKYRGSGCPSNGSASTFKLDFHYRAASGNDTVLLHDYGEGGEFTVNGGYYSADYIILGATIIIFSGTVISSPITFKPMLRLASDTDPTYQPYAMTNRELTQARFLNGTVGTATSNTYTDSAEYTIPSDGWYSLVNQINVANTANTLLIELGSKNNANSIAAHRTSGTQYESANTVLPLKSGTKVIFACTDTSATCGYTVKKID